MLLDHRHRRPADDHRTLVRSRRGDRLDAAPLSPPGIHLRRSTGTRPDRRRHGASERRGRPPPPSRRGYRRHRSSLDSQGPRRARPPIARSRGGCGPSSRDLSEQFGGRFAIGPYVIQHIVACVDVVVPSLGCRVGQSKNVLAGHLHLLQDLGVPQKRVRLRDRTRVHPSHLECQHDSAEPSRVRNRERLRGPPPRLPSAPRTDQTGSGPVDVPARQSFRAVLHPGPMAHCHHAPPPDSWPQSLWLATWDRLAWRNRWRR